ncbi:16S rRNA (uracil(1498)-N(3))-methyltransferase [Sphingobacterium bovistauri]|uniref:Ribosomal RNA small subunit methyltransferase E n=1 Tax=Sphingobacterium bovistauri TaxID=2781959 RepID=A0ABS7Z7G3_9SPHI|nr:16S rRNA (uracil(1498)-N(3))-methyltransferase [Sphingobacterium bovistauri]MCA5006095.1 16S rRNA (uracil(1498)-N(3))-methyltransferase [Sphingobacterium bovistauri]
MQLFFTPDIESQHKSFILSEEESKHAIRVLRLTVGEIIHLIDGRGGIYETEIIDAHPKRTTLRVLSVQENFGKISYKIHLAVAPTKNIDRIEWFLEKATEVGLTEFTPVICEHSERKEVKVERLEKVAVAAMKQSLKAYIPKINPAITFSKFIDLAKDSGYTKGIAHCVDSEKKFISTSFNPKGNYLILIGPEGDFSEKEISQALDAGFVPLSLGEARLRTETAALASVIEVSLLNR